MENKPAPYTPARSLREKAERRLAQWRAAAAETDKELGRAVTEMEREQFVWLNADLFAKLLRRTILTAQIADLEDLLAFDGPDEMPEGEPCSKP